MPSVLFVCLLMFFSANFYARYAFDHGRIMTPDERLELSISYNARQLIVARINKSIARCDRMLQ